MRKLYLSLLSLFTAVQVSALPARPATKPSPIGEDQLSAIQKHIAFSEYFIRWQGFSAAYRSPNRQHGLHTSYTNNAMQITPIGDNDWSFSLTLKGIAVKDKLVYQPVNAPLVTNTDNVIRFTHDKQFTVEYINSTEGIRQNFIVHRPVPGARQLSVQLFAAEGWNIRQSGTTRLTFTQGAQSLHYDSLKVWDAKGRVLPAHFEVSGSLVVINVEAKDAAYPITIDPLVTNGTPQNANLFLQSNQVYGQMGFSVSSAGDVNADGYDDIIVGAPGYTNGQYREGVAYVYYGSSKGINPTTGTLLQCDIDTAQFGYCVKGLGDVNGDGFDDVGVGAPQVMGVWPLLGFVGRFYVYYGSSAGISTTNPDLIEGANNNAYLGEVVSAAGDVNGDGYKDIIVSSRSAESQYGTPGIAWLYYGGPWGIMFTAPLQLEENIPAVFAMDVDGAGDVNGDGYDDVIIGSIGINSSTRGSARIYYGSSWGIDVVPNITFSRSRTLFGGKVVRAGDVNGDGYDDVMISAGATITSLRDSIFVYNGSAAGTDSIPDAIFVSPMDSASYGWGLASAGDINTDGFSDIIIGAYRARNGQVGEGMAYVHYGSSAGINTTPGATFQSNQVNAQYGFGVAGAGDVNGDGYGDIIIGAPLYASGQSMEGGAFIYHGGATTTTARMITSIDTPGIHSTVVKVYPNPVTSHLSLQYQGLDDAAFTTIQLLNAQGVLITTIQAGNVQNGNQAIDVSRLAPGIYIIIVRNGNNIFREKIIKQ